MTYTFSEGEQKLLPVLLEKLGAEPIPFPFRTGSFRYASMVREAIARKLAEYEQSDVPVDIFMGLSFRMNAPGWVRHPGLFGSVTRWVCYRYNWQRARDNDDHVMLGLNAKDCAYEKRTLAKDFGIAWTWDAVEGESFSAVEVVADASLS